jgi:talin
MINTLLLTAGLLVPGSADCEEAYRSIQTSNGDLDAMSISLVVGFEASPTEVTHQQCQEELVKLTREYAQILSAAVNASRTEAYSDVGKLSKELAKLTVSLVESVRSAVQTTSDQNSQTSILSDSKGLAEALLNLIGSLKDASANPSQKTHENVTSVAKIVTDKLGMLVTSLKSGVLLLRDLDEAIAVVEAAGRTPADANFKTYFEAKEEVADATKVLGATLKRLIGTDKHNLVQLGTAAKNVADCVPPIVSSSKSATAYCTDDKLKEKLRITCESLVEAAKTLLRATKEVAVDPKSAKTNQKFTDDFRSLSTVAAALLEVVKQGSVAEIKCDEAIEVISKQISLVDNTSLFAAAGQLEVNSSTTPSEAVNILVETAKATAVACHQMVVTSGKGTQEELGTSAQKLATVCGKIVSSTKDVAAFNADVKAQQTVLASAKAVLIAAKQIIVAGKDLQKMRSDVSAQQSLQRCAKTAADAIQSLISSSQSLDSSSANVLQTLSATKNAIEDQIHEFLSDQSVSGTTPNQVLQVARKMAGVSARLVPNSEEDIAAICHESEKTVQELLETTKGAAAGPEKVKIMNAAKKVADLILNTLEKMKQRYTTGVTPPGNDSQAIADALSELIGQCRSLPGGESLKLEDDSTEDMEDVAKIELARAAKTIEEVAKQLAASKPPPKPKLPGVVIDTSEVTTGAVYDAAVAIASAAQKLLAASAAAQNDRVNKQKQNPAVYKKDGMWANGLIGASKNVAGAVQALVITANKTVNGGAAVDEMEVVAKAVAAATAQLVTASRVKSETGAHNQISGVAKLVTEATNRLVEASKEFAKQEEQEQEIEQASNYTGSVMKHMEAQMKILRLEKELQKARVAMAAQRKSEYQK